MPTLSAALSADAQAGGRQAAATAERIREEFTSLDADLARFVGCPREERDALREALDWPRVGRVTSLARALCDESRFEEWARFNRAAALAGRQTATRLAGRTAPGKVRRSA